MSWLHVSSNPVIKTIKKTGRSAVEKLSASAKCAAKLATSFGENLVQRAPSVFIKIAAHIWDFRWVLLIYVSVIAAGGSGMQLVVAPFPTSQWLYITYFVYTVSLIVFFHACFFAANQLSMLTNEKPLSKRVPKYLEYVYAAVISLGLLQVFFASQGLADYINYTTGGEESILSRARTQARNYLANECNVHSEFFPKDYCDKLRVIAEAPDLAEFLLTTVAKDRDFLDHSITIVNTSPDRYHPTGVIGPFKQYIEELRSERAYATVRVDIAGSHALTWLSIVFLPIGIALRLVKTSLELYIELA